MRYFKFEVQAKRGRARAGVLSTPHGEVLTPVFMPVATSASVKSLDADDLLSLDAQVVLGNTYHLHLRPGDEVVAGQGGLHEFSKFRKPWLTDSGGYQVSSLGLFREEGGRDGRLKRPEIGEEGVVFYSHLDGSEHWLTPERSIEIQYNLGADIVMAFDEATPNRGKGYAREAMERTNRWLARCVDRWRKIERDKTGRERPQALFGIVQGDRYEDLRREAMKAVLEYDLPGLAIGGGSIGSSVETTSENLGWVRDLLPTDRPVYTMGVGVGPYELVSAVLDGADMMDCVAPTRLARSGMLYTTRLVEKDRGERMAFGRDFPQMPELVCESEEDRGRIQIGNRRYGEDKRVIMADCGCATCRKGYSRAYLRHLFRAGELSYYRLATIHNLWVMLETVRRLRQAILNRGDS